MLLLHHYRGGKNSILTTSARDLFNIQKNKYSSAVADGTSTVRTGHWTVAKTSTERSNNEESDYQKDSAHQH